MSRRTRAWLRRGRTGGLAPLLIASGLIAAGPGLAGCSPESAPPETEPPPAFQPCRKPSPPPADCGAPGGTTADLLSFDPGGRGPMLADKTGRLDRVFSTIITATTGLDTEVDVTTQEGRDAVIAFAEGEGLDFEAETGMPLETAVSGWSKVAGAYGGVGIAADAFRYGTLREQGPCDLVPSAREALLRDLDALHLATAITGVPGVIARGFARTDVAGIGQSVMTVPLFDDAGQPLPEEKNNGTWREDASGGQYPGYVWEDSCSVDQLVGWAVGFAAAWEIIADDPAVDASVKDRLQADAAEIGRALMQVRESGYDLEIRDADGRRTYHGILNENGIDTFYLDGADNGFNGVVALGIVAALAYVAEQSDLFEYIEKQLVEARGLDAIVRDNMIGVDLGPKSNFSNYNMAFAGGFLAQRYLCVEGARGTVREAIATSLYDRGKDRQPSEQKQTFFDFVYALSTAGATAYAPMQSAPDAGAVERGVDTLVAYPDAPFWDEGRVNCDDAEIASGTCVTVAGDTIELLGAVGWNDELVSKTPIPLDVRPPSNYFWRSNPYQVNGGGASTRLLPAVDYRFVYWLARWAR